MDNAHVDNLLERYLHLLHEYTSLREQLSTLQTGMYQDIARANFAAERGLRFGRDHYDERMQATRRLAIAPGDQGVPSFVVAAEDAEDNNVQSSPEPPKQDPNAEGTSVSGTPEASQQRQQEELGGKEGKPAQKKRNDPLKWFGLLTPMPLRQAQAQSIQGVEQVIPKLVSINAEMAQVEIEVRRARKKRAKAEMAAAKQEQESVPGKEVVA